MTGEFRLRVLGGYSKVKLDRGNEGQNPEFRYKKWCECFGVHLHILREGIYLEKWNISVGIDHFANHSE